MLFWNLFIGSFHPKPHTPNPKPQRFDIDIYAIEIILTLSFT
jgi:hypothetical protein